MCMYMDMLEHVHIRVTFSFFLYSATIASFLDSVNIGERLVRFSYTVNIESLVGWFLHSVNIEKLVGWFSDTVNIEKLVSDFPILLI